ncbi:MAG: PD-(D/E)XK nuclease family protein [Limisphaerales bacterium]|jgi:ATP-dependent helicase/nuclease subunit B
MCSKVNILTGPAGSGKTTHCVESAVDFLRSSPRGLPLIFLLPRQATFQIEQAVYSDRVIGSRRLQVVSFERASLFLFKLLGKESPRVLSQESCAMLLQVILNKYGDKLSFYPNQCQDTDLTTQLLKTLTSFHQHKISRESLKKSAKELTGSRADRRLSKKLLDLAFLYEKYLLWLQEKKLLDENLLLPLLSQSLSQWKDKHPEKELIEHVWLDGFVELSQQEIEFLGALAKVSKATTIVLCLEQKADENASKNQKGERTFWNYTLPFFEKIKNYFSDQSVYDLTITPIAKNPECSRFSSAPSLEHLEKQWLKHRTKTDLSASFELENQVEVYQCSEFWDEAISAARKIIEYVQGGNGLHRYRDCFVAFRNITPYQGIFQRVFKRYNIPFFIDIPQSILYHPAAELTLQAFETVAFGWKNFNLLSTLKTELAGVSLQEIDVLEEGLLKHNYSGKELWSKKLWRRWPQLDKSRAGEAKKQKELQRVFENIQKKSIAPLLELDITLRGAEKISGNLLADAIEKVWKNFALETNLNAWSQQSWSTDIILESGLSPNIHSTVWEELKKWLENIRLAFGTEFYTLQEWGKILKAGIKALSVAAIPPSLDQVVLGNIERSRSSSVKVVIVPGLNETAFPAYEDEQGLLTENDLSTLQGLQINPIALSLDSFQKTDRENYLSYISFTRSSRKLIASYAEQDDEGLPLYPSRYVHELQKIFPQLELQKFSREDIAFENILSHAEVSSCLEQNCQQSSEMLTLEAEELNKTSLKEALSDLYNSECSFSVSSLESYANCPFQFFVKNVAKAKEREEWGIGYDKLGTLIHQALRFFHKRTEEARERISWRLQLQDVVKSRQLIRECVAQAAEEVFQGSDDSNFTDLGGASELLNVEKKIEFFLSTLRKYFSTYLFDPTFVELDFGKNSPLTRTIRVNEKTVYITGRLDRLDLYKDKKGDIWLAVIDYKSGEKKFEQKEFDAGIQLQLIAYLFALQAEGSLELIKKHSSLQIQGFEKIKMAGAFYVSLKMPFLKNWKRTAKPFQHRGRFNKSLLKGDTAYLDNLDSGPPSQQFSTKKPDAISEGELYLLIDQTQAIVKELIRLILEGQFPVTPLSCEYCLAKNICRFDGRKKRAKKLRPLLTMAQGSEK